MRRQYTFICSLKIIAGDESQILRYSDSIEPLRVCDLKSLQEYGWVKNKIIDFYIHKLQNEMTFDHENIQCCTTDVYFYCHNIPPESDQPLWQLRKQQIEQITLKNYTLLPVCDDVHYVLIVIEKTNKE